MILLVLECAHARDEIDAGAFEQTPEQLVASAVRRLLNE